MKADSRPPRCQVIGVLDDGAASLSPKALSALRQADVVIGAARTLALFAPEISPEATQHDLTRALSQVPAWVRDAQAQGLRCVVLATGDPLCHGIAGFLAARLCFDALEIVPNLSTLQIACARVGLVWQDMGITSVHAADAGEWTPGADARHGLYALAQALRRHDRIAVLTSPDNTPDRIARLILAEGQADDWRMAVAERLCRSDERIQADLSISAAAALSFADPNVVLLWRTRARPAEVLLGLPDSHFEQRQPDKGLITKREVRAVSLARLQLRADSVVWDIGAGSGAVGLEAARLCPRGHVYAIEKNAADAAIAGRNARAMGVSHYTLVHGRAPEGLDAWADPDAVFVGGSGGELPELIRLALQRLRPGGWLVMNFVTLENLSAALEALKAHGAVWDVTQLQAARSSPILHMHRMAAENPVWIVCAQAGQQAGQGQQPQHAQKEPA
ncbi:precorrin-6y C5,15-methyltransferase (decarboxylating) subunit CbiE [Amphibiibacter pelophylacis]|uniref:Precorrin-6y C5,15-methyltransferase (Decarboxylating) subunit CbiE n=1 Tax=Amphibiibacter pelophylacis TaxID=1799477 RepID=A0ACC6NYC2_9BURK